MKRPRSQLTGYRLTTAEILYHMPDHPAVLQSYVWQALDLAPKFPELHKFLDFWQDLLRRQAAFRARRRCAIAVAFRAQAFRHRDHASLNC